MRCAVACLCFFGFSLFTGRIDLLFFLKWGGEEERGKEPFWKFIPLTSKSDWNLIPPYNIIPQSHNKVTRTRERRSFRSLGKFSLSVPIGNVWRTVWRICILMLGGKGLKTVELETEFPPKEVLKNQKKKTDSK